jgi:hypothetical protein
MLALRVPRRLSSSERMRAGMSSARAVVTRVVFLGQADGEVGLSPPMIEHGESVPGT